MVEMTVAMPDAGGLERQSRLWLIVFACLLQAASLAQLPFLQDNAAVKAGLLVVEFSVLVMLTWALRDSAKLRRWLSIAVVLVIIRFSYAWLIGFLRYDISIAGALQEGRFGMLIVIAPVAFTFFRTTNVKRLGQLSLYLAVAIVIADLLVTWFFVRPGYLLIAGRGSSRYVLSVLPMVLLVWVRMIVVIRSGLKPSYGDLGFLLFALVHIILFSTSRSEALICGAMIGQWIYIRAPHLRWLLLGAFLVVAYFLFTSIKPAGEAQVAGRDYYLAIAYSRDAFPFGVGLVPEAVQKAQLGTAGTFFASDYGIILLIYRYGLVGIFIGIAALTFWTRFLVRTIAIPGNFIVAMAVLLYLMIIPLFDYGSLVGGLLLGAMGAVISAAWSATHGKAGTATPVAARRNSVPNFGYNR